MTATTWTPGLCPRCFGAAHAPLSDGRSLCLNPDCRHEFGPDDEPTRLRLVDANGDDDGPDYRSDDVPAPPVLVDPFSAARERYLGREVIVFDLEQVGTVTSIDDDGLATIEFGSGFTVVSEPDNFSLVEPDVPLDDVVQEIVGTDLAVVSQILRAGIETIDYQEAGMRLGMAPDGWLPMEADIMPIIEHGAAYAVAWLAVTFNVSKQQLSDAAQAFADAALAAKEATTP